MKTLVTGWSGKLGRDLITLIKSRSESVLLAGRTPPDESLRDCAYLKLDMLDRSSKPELRGVDIIYHLASGVPNFNREVDVEGTRHLLKAAKASGLAHFVYVSIVGIEKVPIKYYQIKLETERVVKDYGVPFTILRATQFHQFFTWQISRWARSWVPIIPQRALFQPIDIRSVSKALVAIGMASPRNETQELGGPEVFPLGEAMDFWMRIKNRKRPVLNIPTSLLGAVGNGLRQGALTTSQADREGMTWKEWVRNNHSKF